MPKKRLIATFIIMIMMISNLSSINVQALNNYEVETTVDYISEVNNEFTDELQTNEESDSNEEENKSEYIEVENSEVESQINENDNDYYNNLDDSSNVEESLDNEEELEEEKSDISSIGEEELKIENDITENKNILENKYTINTESSVEENSEVVITNKTLKATVKDIKIISSTNATVTQMATWAKNKGATDEFISLASIYYQYGSKRGGVNWAIAYVQAAKETGYGKFGGVLTADYHNPCGMKTSTGGGDYEKDAHKKFDTWTQGIIAHLDHLALYAGASGYPKTVYVDKYKSSGLSSKETYDPRHFTSIYGTAKNVSDLGGKWAGSSTYGTEILNMYYEALATTALDSVSGLDTPSKNQTITDGKLNISGWALTSVGVDYVNIYIDGVKVGSASYGSSRTDIGSKYSSYPNANKGGFSATIDVSKLGSGSKKLEILIRSKDGTKQVITRTFTNVLESRAKIETPSKNAEVNNGILTISGWALEDSGVDYVNVYVDGVKVGRATYGINRTDISKKYPGYSVGSKCGYEATIDICNLTSGTKKLEIVVRAKDGSKNVIETKFINVLPSRAELETPANGASITDNTLSIKGWALAESGVNYINVYVDGTKVGTADYGVERTDISKKYSGYTVGSNCGFSTKIDISSLSNGNKKVEVLVRANDGTKQVLTVKVKKVKISRAEIETPKSNATVSNGKLTIKGWALADSGIEYVNVYANGTKVARATYGITRSDINKKYTGYTNGSKSGFEATIDVSTLPSGKNKIEIVARAKDGTKKTVSVNFNNILPSVSKLETPTKSASITEDTLSIKGWALADSGVKYVNVYLDGTLVGTAKYGVKRTDIGTDYSNYSNASKAGYTASIDLSKVTKGSKKLEILVRANDGSKQVISRTINVTKAKTVYIDAGHDYGGDQGAFSKFGSVTYSETELNIEIAEYLRTELINKGYNVIMCRRKGEKPTCTDYKTNLNNRINEANKAKADFYVSIHQNSSTSSSSKGTEVYYSTVNGAKLSSAALKNKINVSSKAATTISSNIAKVLSTTNRGAKVDEWMVTKYTEMPAILVECGFISNKSEAEKLANKQYQKKIAKAIADAI